MILAPSTKDVFHSGPSMHPEIEGFDHVDRLYASTPVVYRMINYIRMYNSCCKPVRGRWAKLAQPNRLHVFSGYLRSRCILLDFLHVMLQILFSDPDPFLYCTELCFSCFAHLALCLDFHVAS